MQSLLTRNRLLARSARSTLERRWKSSTSVEKPAAESTSSSSSVPIGASIAAAFAGVSVVTIFTGLVEYSTANSCLPYDPSQSGQRFSADTFQGRFSRMILACDPRLLFYSTKEVQDAQELLARYAEFADDRSKDRELWEARRIVDAALHPDSGEVIPRPFRMSGYVPYNGPICVAMVASTSTMQLLFWSWVNQSQNALVNYFNRNASSPMSNETLLKSYSAAVGSALTVAFGLATFVNKRYSPAQAAQLMKFVAFPSAIVASSLNCYIVRSPEIDSGIHLLDESGKVIADDLTSKEAARQGVNSTTLSRAILQVPVYFLPPLLMTGAGPLGRILQRHPTARVPITTFLVLVSFGLGLPAAVALFPQIASIDASKVEPEFQKLINPKTQQPYTVFYYNKGL